jgi:hypothetical protein
MPSKSCIICSAVASPDLQLQYCAQCQSAKYCSKDCQRIDWREKQHKQICKLLNVGHGDLQFRSKIHTDRHSNVKKVIETLEHSLDEDDQRFFKLFQESTFEESQAAEQKMKKIAKRQSKNNQKIMLFQSLCFLIRSDSEMLAWPNSPLLVMLQFVDPSQLLGENDRGTPLHRLADLADPFDYSTHVNQLILAKQLIERGANVNAVSIPDGRTPLHNACYSGNVTNLDFVELLLENGADPNVQDCHRATPLTCTMHLAPGAARFLLKWPTTDANIITGSGETFLANVRSLITIISAEVERPDNHEKVQNQFQLQQWRGIEEMLVERGP